MKRAWYYMKQTNTAAIGITNGASVTLASELQGYLKTVKRSSSKYHQTPGLLSVGCRGASVLHGDELGALSSSCASTGNVVKKHKEKNQPLLRLGAFTITR